MLPKQFVMSKKPRLARALDALAKERQRVQRDMQQVNDRRARMTGAITRLAECRDAVGSTALVDDQGCFDPELYLVSRTAEARMNREIEELGGRLDHFDREVTETVRSRLKEAAQREKAVGTLLERRLRSESDRVERAESRDLDEFAQRNWIRKQGPFGRGD